jgi:hypothetical protein
MIPVVLWLPVSLILSEPYVEPCQSAQVKWKLFMYILVYRFNTRNKTKTQFIIYDCLIDLSHTNSSGSPGDLMLKWVVYPALLSTNGHRPSPAAPRPIGFDKPHRLLIKSVHAFAFSCLSFPDMG